MLLVFDIGNRTVAAGLFAGERLALDFRLGTDAARNAEEYAAQILSHLERAGYEAGEVEAAAVASVVPAVTEAVCGAVRGSLHIEPYVLGPATNYGIENRYSRPDRLGVDRLVNAVAAWERLRRPCVVVDCGTAITVDAVADGAFLGGAILPGVSTSVAALGGAALLRGVRARPPSSAIGRDTEACVGSGVILGLALAVEGLVRRFAEEMGSDPRVLATGGEAELISSHSGCVDEVVPSLTLEGIRLVAERNPIPKRPNLKSQD